MVQRFLEPPSAVEREIVESSPLADFRIIRSDGHSLLRVATEDGQQLTAHVRFVDEAAWIMHEASQNAAAMVTQQRRLPSTAREVAEMIQRGARPDIEHTHVRYFRDRQEFGFLLQFPNHAPLPLLFTQAQIDSFRAKQYAARKDL
ncbi:hypothetical protein GR217_34215 [Rhizobium leguminosarum]|uniref:Uncharacterized protein n=1 Tax=Rhizobium ruizarguesonis TaxID=2081791 RepID=A0AAE4YX69_9HYPH|nr:hypothetical protein [Rhizobium ruizarguesonis]NEI52675.1 hypothetical protein [Rhizobium ruizarguesonis]